MTNRVWVEVDERREIRGVDYYVALAITRGSGIPLHLFVLNVDGDTLSHVASVAELDVLPKTPGDALARHFTRYLSTAGNKTFDRPSAMETFLQRVRLRIDDLLRAWPGESTLEIPGRTVYLLPSEPVE